MRTLNMLWIVVLVAVYAYAGSSVTNATATPDPLHIPALKPTPEATVLPANIPQIPVRWDGNADGVVDIRDVDIAAGDLAAMTSYLNMHGGTVSVTVPIP